MANIMDILGGGSGGVSTSSLAVKTGKESAAKKLGESTAKQEEKGSWIDTAMGVGLPILASILMPGVGTILSGLASGLGAGYAGTSAALNVLKYAPKALDLLGKGLQYSRTAGQSLKGIEGLKALGAVGAKTLGTTALRKTLKGVTQPLRGKAEDITAGGSPYGAEALEEFQQDFTKKFGGKDTTLDYLTDLVTGFSQAGGADEAAQFAKQLGLDLGGVGGKTATVQSQSPNVTSGTLFDKSPTTILQKLGLQGQNIAGGPDITQAPSTITSAPVPAQWSMPREWSSLANKGQGKFLISAKELPASNLTTSGMRMPSTWETGIQSGLTEGVEQDQGAYQNILEGLMDPNNRGMFGNIIKPR